MELRHLRYFVVVGETLSFNKAAAKLRIAQPALSRQVQDLEDEIGVDLFSRSPRGVTLTAEGKLFLEEARAILQRTEEATARTRALARGEYGELHIGYSPTPTAEILPPALVAFQKAIPGVKIILHDLAGDELNAGLLDGSLQLAVMVERADETSLGLRFEELRRYRFCIAAAPDHSFAKLKSVSVARAAVEPLIAFRRKEYSGYYRILEKIFSPHDLHPRVAVECDSASSLITEVEIGRGIAIVSEVYRQISGKRLVYRQFSDSDESYGIGIMTALKGDATPAGEKFCEFLRKISKRA
jgi:DNA-binding transcriptional LysR family regulator